MRIILSHRYPDFDALASMIAAQKLFPGAVMVMDGEVSASVQDFMALAKEQLAFQQWRDLDPDAVTEVILVDINDFRKTSLDADSVSRLRQRPLRIFDHHPLAGETPFVQGDVVAENILIEPVGATVTLLVERLAALGNRRMISSFEATVMMLGIYHDTGSLLFESTTPRDIEAAAFLLRLGAQLGVVAEYMHTPLNPQQLALFQQLLDHGAVEKIRGVPVFFSHAEEKVFSGGLALLAHRIGEIESADVWFILVKMDKRVHIVARSRHPQVAVNKIVEAFGGSGHVKAASATVKNGSLSDVLTQLRLETAKWVQAPQTAREIMSYPVKTVTPDTRMGELGQILLRNGHTGMPVAEDGFLLGIISRRDIDKALRYELSHAPVKGFMSRDVVTVDPEDSWEDVQQCMIAHNIGRVPVVEEGNLVGIITRSDILRMIYGQSLPIAIKLAQDRGMAMREDVGKMLGELPDPLKKVITTVSEAAGDLGLGVYLVGGSVRDLLLRVPTQDVDLVVEGQAEVLAQALCERLPGSRFELFGQFGTARLTMDKADTLQPKVKLSHIDIVGSRSESYASPGALPTVEGSTLRDDLFRRDFTINAMAICLNRERLGELVDYYGGLRDLQQKEIRILHNLSFIDDPMRIIRAMRFAGRYGFGLARLTRDAIQTALQEGVIETVSVERFSEELLLVLAEDAYRVIWRMLAESGVLGAWFKAMDNGQWTMDNGEGARGNERLLSWTKSDLFDASDETIRFEGEVSQADRNYDMSLLETKIESDPKGSNNCPLSIVPCPLLVRFLSLLIDLNDEQMEQVLGRLKIVRQWRKNIEIYLSARKLLRESLGTLEEVDVILAEVPAWLADVLMLNEDIREMISAYRRAAAGMNMGITGHDLRRKGVPEGPYIGRLLRQIRARWLEGRILTAEDESAYVEVLLANMKKEG
ncbi:MAG: CBS domain-containing protein [Gracilibacteraceae bacterium]|jgi:tRNA nucleotidyltransferase (CCA-adding enzyme)|nr:CBS domain-containing protein [Gracilibacteraceae bacterium]